jgi:hypothetical protein
MHRRPGAVPPTEFGTVPVLQRIMKTCRAAPGTRELIPQFHHPILPPVLGRRRRDPIRRHALHQHVLAVPRRLRPLPDGAVFALTPPQYILGRRAARDLRARREAVVVEMVAPRHVVRVAIGRAGQCRGVGQRRELMLGAEGIEVEGKGGGGKGAGRANQRDRRPEFPINPVLSQINQVLLPTVVLVLRAFLISLNRL